MTVSYKKLRRIQDQTDWVLTENSPIIHSSGIQKDPKTGVLHLCFYNQTATTRLKNKIQKRINEQFDLEVPLMWPVMPPIQLEKVDG